MKKLVYRVEHKRLRLGPYRCFMKTPNKLARFCQRMSNEADKECKHPLPHEDGMYRYETLYFGFESIKQALDWFEQWLTDLNSYDFHLAVFKVEETEIVRGYHQIAFARNKYRRVGSIPLVKELLEAA